MDDNAKSLTAEEEIEKLCHENDELLLQLQGCYEEFNKQTALLLSLKRNIRRYEVQINSLKIENDNFKRKFGIIENNIFGSALLNVYRRYKHIILKYEK